MATPRWASLSETSRVSQGSADEVSRSSEPGLKPSASPSAPNATSRTSRPEGSMVTTMSDAAATSAGVVASRTFRNRRRRASPAAGFRSSTVTGYPAAARCPAIGPPMTPSPIKPIGCSSSTVHLPFDLAGWPSRGPRSSASPISEGMRREAWSGLCLDPRRPGAHLAGGPDGWAVAVSRKGDGGKSGLHGEKAAGNARRGRPQG